MSEWMDIESAPRDGTQFLASLRVCHRDGRQWRETHLIWWDYDKGGIHQDCEQGWDFDDYEIWCPIPEINQ